MKNRVLDSYESIRNYDVMEHKFEKELRWDDLVDEYQTMLYRIAFSNMKNRADAEDVVQEAFLRYMKDEKPILNREHEKAWLIRTTIHICMDILKSSWHRKTVALDESLTAETRSVWLPYQIKDDRALEAVLQLPVHYRNPIYLFYYEDYSIQEIAGILNEKEGTIKTRLRRGREEVKKILTEGRP
ncbi:MAG: sigma-70 family RNA polymerase sigma factor [Lachnospiraceae bacterium]|nr:sigma-70 family RNA polymerase sigma factor [Lachnospiraceae bacterium]